MVRAVREIKTYVSFVKHRTIADFFTYGGTCACTVEARNKRVTKKISVDNLNMPIKLDRVMSDRYLAGFTEKLSA